MRSARIIRRRLIYLTCFASLLLAVGLILKISHKVEVIRNLYAAGGDVQTWSRPPTWVKRYCGDWIAEMLSSPKAVRFDGEMGDPSRLNDDLLGEIIGFSSVRSLFIYKCNVTGDGFRCIGKSSQINELQIVDCPVEDKNIRYLTKMEKLRDLTVVGTKVTSNSVKYISQISSLDIVAAWDTDLDEEDANEIRAKLPMCQVLVKPVVANPENRRRSTKRKKPTLPKAYRPWF